MSKLFPKKKDKSPKEETKSISKVLIPESVAKSTSKSNLQSRLMTFFTKKSKSKEQPKQDEQ